VGESLQKFDDHRGWSLEIPSRDSREKKTLSGLLTFLSHASKQLSDDLAAF
jgi:hypothetical protein